MAQATLTHHNTMRLAAVAEKSIEITDVFQLKNAVHQACSARKPLMVLGEASNVLLPESFAGHVLWMRLRGIKIYSESVDSIDVEVAAGENWHRWVLHTISKGWYGLENLAMIPGSVGAAPVQNIGAYGVSVADCLLYCKVWQPDTGRLTLMDADSCAFGYRDSVFKRQGLSKGVIVAVGFRLSKVPMVKVEYPSLQQFFSKYPVFTELQPEDVFHAVTHIRREKLPDVRSIGTCGSFFTNPIIDQATWKTGFSAHMHSLLHHVVLEDGRVKLFAGQLLRLAGWAGQCIDGVHVCARNPIVLMNQEGYSLTRSRLLAVATRLQQSCWRIFGVSLQLEPSLEQGLCSFEGAEI